MYYISLNASHYTELCIFTLLRTFNLSPKHYLLFIQLINTNYVNDKNNIIMSSSAFFIIE